MLLRAVLLSVPTALLLLGCGGDDTSTDPAASSSGTATETATPTTTPSPTAPSTPAATPTRTPTKTPKTPKATSAPAAPVVTPDADPALREAAQAYSDAWLTGDAPAAFDLLSDRCKDSVDMREYGDGAIAAGKKYGKPQPIATYSEEVSGDTASLSYTFEGSAPAHEDERWVRERGYWHLDDC